MAAAADRSDSNILQELDALSQTLYPSRPNRRPASLALSRSSSPVVNAIPPPSAADHSLASAGTHRPRSRRMSMSPFRSRPKSIHEDDDSETNGRYQPPSKNQHPIASSSTGDKKGIWNWKPLRALSHITMQRLGCLFSVEVAAIQGLPPSMNGLRLSVAVRKKETKDGAVQTMPSRVLQGSAEFEETLFIRCHVYCSGKPLKFESRPFVISALAIDAPELDFGKSTVDLSLMVKESMERSVDGERIRQWDAAFPLAGKAKGGELAVKLGFQIMEDGGVAIYNQAEGSRSSKSNLARGQSKSSFSVSSPKITRSEPFATPSKENLGVDLRGIDDFNLDEPGPPPSTSPPIRKPEPEPKTDDFDLPEFEVIDKGIEIQAVQEEEGGKSESEEPTDKVSEASEVVKEVVHDSAHLVRLTELDAIAQQIKALESIVTGDGSDPSSKTEQDGDNQQLDAEEETVTREFLQMLELEDDKDPEFDMPDLASLVKSEAEEGTDGEKRCFLSDLGKGLGPIVQTRDGGYLAAMNPFDVEVPRKEPPKLAMQISKPIILKDQKLGSGFEVFQRLAALGSEELSSKLVSLMPMDELMGKTAEQIAFEGMASAIISGRNREGASSSAARTVALLKTMAATMSDGRKERIVTGIWNVKEEPVIAEEILSFSMQKIEAMAVEALKIQADVADEEAPFDVSPLIGKEDPLEATMAKSCEGANAVTMLVIIQVRDPIRRYETVGAPAIAVVQATRAEIGGGRDEEGRFKVTSLHVGGMQVKSGGKRSNWDGEKQSLTAMQWLVACGLAKAAKKSKNVKAKGGQDAVWSISSRMMADMWLKPMRNPDVKFAEKL